MATPAGAPDRTGERVVSDALAAALRARAEPDGFVPYDAVLDAALYAPGAGYYRRSDSPFGPEGDFYTAPRVHPLFARALAARVASALRELPTGRRPTFVELGPGDGQLAEQLILALPEDTGARPLDYLLVDRAEERLAEAVRRTEPVARSRGIRLQSSTSLAGHGPVAGVVVANEVMDALPARRLRFDGTGWGELGIRLDGTTVVPSERSPSTDVPGRPLPSGVERGTIVELPVGAESLVREIADHLVAGVAVILDYGMDEGELVRAHPRGTLAAVAHHRAVDDPLSALGHADLSVFVNFDRLRDAARAGGLAVDHDRPQSEALDSWGLSSLFDAELRATVGAEAQVRLRLAVKNLLFGFARFRALELSPVGRARSTGAARTSG